MECNLRVLNSQAPRVSRIGTRNGSTFINVSDIFLGYLPAHNKSHKSNVHVFVDLYGLVKDEQSTKLIINNRILLISMEYRE